MFRRFYDWLTLRDYERAKQESTRRIVARLSRGNIPMSQGRYMTKEDLDRAAEKTERELAKFEKAVKKYIG